MLRLRIATFLAILLPLSAQAAPLAVVNVNAPAINCVYNITCTIVVTDSVGNFAPPGASGVARLQSRTYNGAAPAPAAGKLGYEYRVDLTSVSGAANCVTKMQLLVGPVVKEPYPPGALKDVFVVTSGGLGSVGIASAEQTGGMITFTFDGNGVCPGQTSYFFGLTSAVTAPRIGMARLYFSLGGATSTPARIP